MVWINWSLCRRHRRRFPFLPFMLLHQEVVLWEQALSLTVRCLNFDFIGTNPDESTEDVGTIQAPTSWRPLMQDSATTDLFFDFYVNTEPPRSSKAMEAIILLASVRRSLFPTDKDTMGSACRCCALCSTGNWRNGARTTFGKASSSGRGNIHRKHVWVGRVCPS